MEGQEGPAEEVENSENVEVNLKDDEQTPEEDQLLDSKAKEANELEVANGADNFDDGTLDQLVDDVQTSDDEEEQADEKDESEEGEESDDAMLEEAGRILMDMIGLSIQFAQLESVPADPAITAANLPVPQPQANADTDG